MINDAINLRTVKLGKYLKGAKTNVKRGVWNGLKLWEAYEKSNKSLCFSINVKWK